MDAEDFDSLAQEVLADRDARVAAQENALRREIAVAINAVRAHQEISLRSFAGMIGTSLSQVQRLLQERLGGSLTLRTICRAADSLNLAISIHIRPRNAAPGKLLEFGRIGWSKSHANPGVEASLLRPPMPRPISAEPGGGSWKQAVGWDGSPDAICEDGPS